jgi:hypothetical protein
MPSRLNRYLIFGSYVYYPAGGWDDFLASKNELEQAKKCATAYVGKDASTKWAHVIDRRTGEEVYSC